MEIENFRVDIHKSIEFLKNRVIIPKFQRSEDRTRVENIKIYISKKRLENKAPCLGTIDLCYFNEDYYVIDGQHRIKALIEDFEESNSSVPFAVIIYNVKTVEEMKEIFQTRNLGFPVPDYILNAKDDRISLIKECEAELSKMPLFQNCRNCNRPSVKIPVFMEYLTQSKFWPNIKNIWQFIDIVNKLNKQIQEFYTPTSTWSRNKITDPMWQKARKNNIYIGLDPFYGFKG